MYVNALTEPAVPGFTQIVWDDGPGGNVEHCAGHGVSPEEAESVVRDQFEEREPSRSNPVNWVVQGETATGRYLVVVFAYPADLDIVIPVTAYEPGEQE